VISLNSLRARRSAECFRSFCPTQFAISSCTSAGSEPHGSWAQGVEGPIGVGT
jgi:hypothetical protein